MKRRKNNEGSYSNRTIKGVVYKRYRFPDGKEVYGRTAEERDRKIEAYKEHLERLKSEEVIPNRITLGIYYKEWLKKKKGDISSRTYDDYEDIYRIRLQKFNGNRLVDVYLQSITEKMITDYLNDLAGHYSHSSVVKTWVVLKRIFKDAIYDKVMPTIALDRVRVPKEKEVAVPKKEIPLIDFDDMEELYIECLKTNSNNNYVYGHNALVIIFIMYTGLRISEAIGLKWKYVDRGFNYIKVAEAATRITLRDQNNDIILNDKGQKKYINMQKDPKSVSGQRTVPLSERAQMILQYMYQFNPNHVPDEFVFLTSNKTKITANNVQKTLRRILENSNCRVKNYTPHALRHGYGSILLSKGTDIKVVSKLLGHKSITTTYDIYIDVYKEEVAEQVRNVFDKKQKETPIVPRTEQSSNDMISQLREYKQLLDEGILTEEEFAQVKARLLK